MVDAIEGPVSEETHINPALRPYSWYKRFVVEGASQHRLPPECVNLLEGVEAIGDPDPARDAENRRIQC